MRGERERGRWRCGSELKRERGREDKSSIRERWGVQKRQKEDNREKLGDLMIERERETMRIMREQ